MDMIGGRIEPSPAPDWPCCCSLQNGSIKALGGDQRLPKQRSLDAEYWVRWAGRFDVVITSP
jgi:hypothetical protein